MGVTVGLRGIFFLAITILSSFVLAAESNKNLDEKNVIDVVNQAENYIHQHGKNKSISEFKKNLESVFVIDFNGTVLVSPIHPETVGTNQINFRDSFGVLVVQEEIAKAKAGGGWLKGRYRQNHKTGKYACRKLYILPMKGGYFIGSWYYYPANQKEQCLF